MILKVIGWLCLVVAAVSIFSGVNKNKLLPLVVAAVFLAACYVCLGWDQLTALLNTI